MSSTDEPTPEPRAVVDRPRVKTFIQLAGLGIGFAGLVVALIANFVLGSPDETPSSSGPGATNAGAASPTAVLPQSSLTVGDCLSDDLGAASCNAPHRYEVVALAAQCDDDELLRYLGGIPGTDVLGPHVEYDAQDVDGVSACLLGSDTTPLATSSARDALLGAAADGWRWCVDSRAGRDVPCSEPHKQEVVAAVAPGPEPLDCGSRADDYMETRSANFTFQLSVSGRVVADQQQCVVEALGDNVLTSSIRRLRSNALPLRAA